MAGVFVPDGVDDFVVELDVPVEVPFLGGSFDVGLDVSACGVEVGPVGVGVEGESLEGG